MSRFDSPKMPVHEKIKADGNSEAIENVLDFTDWLRNCFDVHVRDIGTDQQVVGDREWKRIVFEFYGYDYEAWLREKEVLTEYIMKQKEVK